MRRILTIIFWVGLSSLIGCATSHQVECNTRLQPINAPAAKIVATDRAVPTAGGAL
ncbi:MAG: hypothetical protein AB7T07_09005 [Steroidobacteraceae bacterium]